MRISAPEHSRFVAAYRKRAGRLAWVFNGWTILGSIVAAFGLVYRMGATNGWIYLATFIGSIAALVAITWPFEFRPEQELRGRPGIERHSAGRPPWRARRRAAALETTWRSLAWNAFRRCSQAATSPPASTGTRRSVAMAAVCVFAIARITELAIRKLVARGGGVGAGVRRKRLCRRRCRSFCSKNISFCGPLTPGLGLSRSWVTRDSQQHRIV